ncbi:response regulator transcription factor [Erysipelothrix aquatica]|uniref:response regulator transcription factor n=1 Tax=Erysipelothrix aquatica TaxID=2683714 RepID=UPI00135C6A22|nr:response regulator transcription factor [Erysipelothrix aquatica]
MKKILIADDEADIRNILKMQLELQGYEVEVGVDGQDAVEMVESGNQYDLVLLDIMMPRLSGVDACIKIRKITNVPILFLTAKSGEQDIVEAYANGGDDFLSKPFSKVELMAKVDALIRRYRIYSEKSLNSDDSLIVLDLFSFDIKRRIAKYDGVTVELTNVETDILFLLLRNRGRVFDTKQIFEEVWREQYYAEAGNTVMVHVFNLRKKLETSDKSSIVKTVWGKGYRIDVDL